DGEELVPDPQRLFGPDPLGVEPPLLHLRLLALRQVARHLGEADELAGPTSQRGDDDVGPEAGAVLADAPPLVFYAPLSRGLGPQPRRAPVRPILGRIEELDRLAHDLVVLVTLDEGRAGVPGLDPPLAVEHEHRIVTDAL